MFRPRDPLPGLQALALAALTMTEMGVSRGPGPCEPELQMNHSDGPLLTTRFGEPYWLSFVERIKLYFGWTNAETLEQDFYLRRFQKQLNDKAQRHG